MLISSVSAEPQKPFCGPQVLHQILNNFERPSNLKKLEALAEKQYGLTSFTDLSREARKQKLHSLSFKDGDLSLLKQAIAQGYVVINNRGHFALIERIDGNDIHVYNPGFSAERYSLNWDIFDHHWDHKGLIISDKKIRLDKIKYRELSKKEANAIMGANVCGNTIGLGGTSSGYSVGNGTLPNTSPSSSGQKQPSTKDPVHIQNGNLHIDDEDMSLPAQGLSLNLTRYYNSQIVSEVQGLLPEEGAGSWTIENGEYSGEGDRSGTVKTWKDLTIEADMQTIQSGAQSWETAWINFRYIDDLNRYTFLIHNNGTLELAKRQGSASPIVLSQVASAISPSSKNKIKIIVLENNIKSLCEFHSLH